MHPGDCPAWGSHRQAEFMTHWAVQEGCLEVRWTASVSSVLKNNGVPKNEMLIHFAVSQRQ